MRISDWSSDVCSSDLAPRVSSTQALASAKRAALGSRLLGMRVQAEKSRQVVFVGDDGRAHMAWQVSFFADSAGGGSPTSPLVIVDAASGAILTQFDALKNVEIGAGPEIGRAACRGRVGR